MSSDYEKAQLLGSRVQLAGSQQKCRAEDMASLFSRGENSRPSALLIMPPEGKNTTYILRGGADGPATPAMAGPLFYIGGCGQFIAR